MFANFGYPRSEHKTKLILLIVWRIFFRRLQTNTSDGAAPLEFIFLFVVALKVYAERTENAKENRYLKSKNDIEQNCMCSILISNCFVPSRCFKKLKNRVLGFPLGRQNFSSF